MSFKVDLKRSSRQILLDLIGKSNDVQLTPGSLLFGTPVTIAEVEGASSNTKVPVQADPRKAVLKSGNEFFYNRLPLEELVDNAPLEMPSSGVVRTLDNALKFIFQDLELGVTSEDFEPQTIAGHGHTVPYTMPLTVSANSLAYTGGSFDIGWVLFDELVASAGVKSCRYDLRRNDAIFQDAVGTTPVTASAQPLGRLVDLFGKGNHATQSTITARPEYWVDPATNEPVTWYDFADDRLLWPGVAGADGTVGIAFSTGAQVFDLLAPAFIPPGPMIELLFFDRRLTDVECAVLQCYLDMQVKDTSWLGYVRGTSFDMYSEGFLEWKETYPTGPEYLSELSQAGMYAEFSKDGRVPFPEPVYWEESDWVEAYANHTTSVARQRFRFGAKDSSVLTSVNYDCYSGSKTWTPDCTEKLKALFPKAYTTNAHFAFGCLHVIRRGDDPVIPTSHIDNLTNRNAVFRYYGKPLANGYLLPDSIEAITAVSPTAVFSNVLPDFSNVKDKLKELIVMNSAGMIFNPKISTVNFSEFTNLVYLRLQNVDFGGAPAPTLPPKLRFRIGLDNCNIGGSLPPNYFSQVTNLGNVWLFFNQLTGNIPKLSNNEEGVGGIQLHNNQFTGYVGGGLKLRPYSDYHYFQNNLLTQAAVDLLISDYLAAALEAPGTSGSRLYVNGTGNAAPSTAGKANAATLRTLGWNVQHNN